MYVCMYVLRTTAAFNGCVSGLSSTLMFVGWPGFFFLFFCFLSSHGETIRSRVLELECFALMSGVELNEHRGERERETEQLAWPEGALPLT